MVIKLKQSMSIMKQKSRKIILYFIYTSLFQIFFCCTVNAQTVTKKKKENKEKIINNKIVGNGNTIVNGNLTVNRKVVKNIIDSSRHYHIDFIENPADTFRYAELNIGFEVKNNNILFFPKIGYWNSPFIAVLSEENKTNQIDLTTSEGSTFVNCSYTYDSVKTDTSITKVRLKKMTLAGLRITKANPAVIIFEKTPKVLLIGDEKRVYQYYSNY